MKRYEIQVVAGLVLLLTSTAGWAQGPDRLLGVLGGALPVTQDPGAVVEIDPDTATLTVLSTPLPGYGLTGIAQLPDGRLFASAVSTQEQDRLLELDPETGALLADLGVIDTAVDPCGQFDTHDLAADPGTGTLYGVERCVSNGPFVFSRLYAIDPDTMATTVIGNIEPNTFMPIAFNDDGLWATPDLQSQLLRIDPATAAVLATTPLPMPSGSQSPGGRALGAEADGQLLMAQIQAGQAQVNQLYRIDPVAATITFLGDLGERRLHDIALVRGVQPVVEVPGPGAAGQALLVLLLALVALLRFRAA